MSQLSAVYTFNHPGGEVTKIEFTNPADGIVRAIVTDPTGAQAGIDFNCSDNGHVRLTGCPGLPIVNELT